MKVLRYVLPGSHCQCDESMNRRISRRFCRYYCVKVTWNVKVWLVEWRGCVVILVVMVKGNVWLVDLSGCVVL